MIISEVVCQDLMTRQLSPAENRVDGRHPVDDSEITSDIQGISLAPKYTLKQRRGIERRARNKQDLHYFRMYANGGMKEF